jgi:hypothetical protein
VGRGCSATASRRGSGPAWPRPPAWLLLLAHEFTRLAGAPLAAGAVLVAACVWAYGTHRLRRSVLPVHTLTVASG